MGAKTSCSAQAPLGEFVTLLTPLAGFRAWAPIYDREPNPLVALEERILRQKLELAPRDRVLDLATGTGRWLDHTLKREANSVGMDLSSAMLGIARAKFPLRGRLVQADICALPFASDCVDLAICSLSLAYIADLAQVMRECSRVARRLIISDMHPAAMKAGWTRSFRVGPHSFDIEHVCHTWSELEWTAEQCGFESKWTCEAHFNEADRPLFAASGREAAFEMVRAIPALLIAEWRRA